VNMSVDEEPLLVLSGRFEEVEFIGNSTLTLGVPFDAPDEFKRKVWSAALSYVIGNRSMDYFHKRYGGYGSFPRPVESRRRLASILRLCSFEVDRVADQLSNGVERQSTLGLFASEAALLRTSVSFRYAAFLLMQGATYEVAATLRLCLEQIAWAFEIHPLDDESVFRKSPTKSISRLKKIEPPCGRIYSLLSKYTHIDPRLQRGYLDFSGEYAAILFRDYDAALKMSDIYINVVNLYVRVSEAISHKYFNGIKAWHIEQNGALSPVSDYTCIASNNKKCG
jgi:hypothetical protein